MKITQNKLNEMIAKSILKKLNEDKKYLNENFDDDDFGIDFDSMVTAHDDKQEDTNSPQQQSTDERIKQIEDYYNTNKIADNGADKNFKRRYDISTFLGKIDKDRHHATGLIAKLANNGKVKFGPDGHALLPWEINGDTLTIKKDIFEQDGLEYFLTAFEQHFPKMPGFLAKIRAKEEQLKRKQQKIESGKKVEVKDLPTHQVEYEPLEDTVNLYGERIKTALYKMDENGQPVMNENFPNMYVFKAYMLPRAFKKGNFEKATNDLEEIFDDLCVYSIYNPNGNDEHGYEQTPDQDLINRIENSKHIGVYGKHPFTNEKTSTIDPYGVIKYWDKDTGEEIWPSNHEEVKNYMRQFINGQDNTLGGINSQEDTLDDINGQEETLDEARDTRVYPQYPNKTIGDDGVERIEYLDKPQNAVDAFLPFQNAKEIFAIYPIRNEDDNLMEIYIVSNEGKGGDDILRQMRSMVTRRYMEPVFIPYKRNKTDKEPFQIKSDVKSDARVLCTVDRLGRSNNTTPLEVLPQELKETFLEDWRKFYGFIARQHNKAVKEAIEDEQYLRSKGYNTKKSNAGMNSIYFGSNITEAKISKMIVESIKKYLR